MAELTKNEGVTCFVNSTQVWVEGEERENPKWVPEWAEQATLWHFESCDCVVLRCKWIWGWSLIRWISSKAKTRMITRDINPASRQGRWRGRTGGGANWRSQLTPLGFPASWYCHRLSGKLSLSLWHYHISLLAFVRVLASDSESLVVPDEAEETLSIRQCKRALNGRFALWIHFS